ncbi:MAG: GNAT family N-acetyltransferase [Gammaproteobacteria bacterium]|nr:GNAT family N-acetyltransferase [Gammaproteobacteria bacterium]
MTDPSRITVRRATAEDAVALADVGSATFVENFGHLYTLDDLQAFLVGSHSPAARARQLAEPGVAVWLAELPGEPAIGYVTIGSCKLPVDNLEAQAAEIRQLYVRKRWHNQQLGARFMQIGLDWLAEQGRTPLYVGVWSENYGAQRFYERYGFTKIGEYGFPVGKKIDREFILKQK